MMDDLERMLDLERMDCDKLAANFKI